MLQEAGVDTTLQPRGADRFNAVGRLQGQGGGKSLMFNGHLDTSFGPEQAHRGIGYECKATLVDDEWIYGMGSFNMNTDLPMLTTADSSTAVDPLSYVTLRHCGTLTIRSGPRAERFRVIGLAAPGRWAATRLESDRLTADF